jgi:ketol-acid reductoisomerase
VVISDTAEYGCYLFAHAAVPMLAKFMKKIDTDVIGKGLSVKDNGVNNIELVQINEAIRYTGVEEIGAELRSYMGAMKAIL